MSVDRNKFIEFLIESDVLCFGEFTTKSGRNTPYFINTGRFITAEQIRKLGEFYAQTIEDEFGSEYENLFGPAYKGIPLVVTTSAALSEMGQGDVTFTFNRKEAKDHGEKGILVGDPYAETSGEKKRIIIVEDVTTAGTSIRESIPLIHSFPNTEVIGLVVSVDRMERGTGERSALQELKEEFGIRTRPIADFNDLVKYLKTSINPKLGDVDALIEKMNAYRETYGV